MNSPTLAFKSFFIFACCALLNACNSQKPAEQNKNAQPSATVATVIYDEITEWDEYTGRLSAPENVQLRARVSGYIDQVHFEEGALVQEGDLLFTIDPVSFKAEVARLNAQLSAAKSNQTNAHSEYQRAKRLIDKQAIAQEVYETRKAQLASTTAQLEAAKANLEVAQLNLDYTEVRSPISGRISNAMTTKGNFISAGQDRLTSIVSTEKIYAYFEADERAYLKYSKLALKGERPSSRTTQNPVLMALASDKDYPYQGHINFVDNSINPLTSTIRGRAVFENKNGSLIPGLFARIRVPGTAPYKAILIDEKAIGTNLDTKFVLVIDKNNTTKRRLVTLGDKFAGLRIITSGLEQGEVIVINGLQKIRPDTQVKPVKQSMASDETLQTIKQLQAHAAQSTKEENMVNTSQTQNVTGG